MSVELKTTPHCRPDSKVNDKDAKGQGFNFLTIKQEPYRFMYNFLIQMIKCLDI